MATKPELHKAVAYAKNRASEYNDNFEMLNNYIEDVSEELMLKVNTINSQLSSTVLSNLQSVYPVGSLYIGVTETCPIANLFGTWEKISEGRVLQGASGEQVVGETVEASLPNIKGQSGTFTYEGGAGTNGAIKTVRTGGNTIKTADYTKAKGYIEIDASLISEVYKDDCKTVQPPAYLVNIWKRVS